MIMTRLFFLLACIVTITSSCNQSEKAANPNIILILTDDQGWGDLSISGNTNIETPNIDRLAETGITFDRFYVSPVCSPTRAEMLTGRYHPRGGVYSTSAGGERLDLDESTIAEYFSSAGYATAAYGKWHNGMQPPYHPNSRGLDDFYGFCSGHWGNYFSPMLEHNGEIVKGNGFLVDDLTDRGIDFIEGNKNRPFFLYLPYNTPHSPMQVPERWWNKFENKDLEMLHREPEKEDIAFTRAALAMCENIDWNVGRIMEKVEELELAENTIIIYLSDNGPNGWRWNGGMKGRKGSTDEGGVRVPMFMKWKGVLQPGKKINEIAGAIDLLPTLADLAGIDFQPEKPLDGVSLKPLLTETNPTWNERLIYSFWAGRTSVRNQQFRLDNEGKLFDMESDSGQHEDVSEKFPEITTQLLQAKKNWEAEVLSELPETDERTFTIGHPEFKFTHIPARDGIAHGNIQRSNRFPNDSFFTNWESTSDSITWEAEVLSDGDFEVEIYYTCPPEDVGALFELNFADEKLTGQISEAHNPTLQGMENDRVERMESYVKDFKPLKLGTIHLKKGKGILTLKATEIPGKQVMDFRLMVLKRI
ncbi:arylsulfatase [Mariniphaga sp.]|uniref:arylsulfatase n=1 Tax=Mariniphaga sp. TaxID=1954475 RepID=UPI003566401C